MQSNPIIYTPIEDQIPKCFAGIMNLYVHPSSTMCYKFLTFSKTRFVAPLPLPAAPDNQQLSPHAAPLEVLLPPNKLILPLPTPLPSLPHLPPPPLSASTTTARRMRIHITLNMQLTAQPLGPTEEHATLARGMYLPDGSEHHIPIRPSEIRRRAETGDCVGLARVEDYVGGVGGGDACC